MAASSSATKVPTRKYHIVTLGRTQFCVDVRFANLRPIGEAVGPEHRA